MFLVVDADANRDLSLDGARFHLKNSASRSFLDELRHGGRVEGLLPAGQQGIGDLAVGHSIAAVLENRQRTASEVTRTRSSKRIGRQLGRGEFCNAQTSSKPCWRRSSAVVLSSRE